MLAFKKHAQDGHGVKRPPKGRRSISSLVVARIRALCASKKHAQDGHGVKRPPKGRRSVSSLVVARIRALCASKKHAQDGHGVKRPPKGRRSVSSLVVARIRALCASKKHAQDGHGVKRPPKGRRSVSSLVVARIRALCASIVRRFSVCSVATCLLAASLSAWGPIGHMTVAYAAYQRLTPETKARVASLLKLNPDYAAWDKQVPPGTSQADHDRIIFVAASVWADDIKGEKQYSDDGPDPGGNVPSGTPASSQNLGYTDLLRHRYWHFVDVPFSPDGTKLPEIPVPNAETQIDAFRAVIASDQPDALKSYDLTWLLHLIGDVHQPLHDTTRAIQTDPLGDAGGNKVSLFGDADFNLHAYWDDLPGSESQFCAKKVHCVDRAGVVVTTLPIRLPKSAGSTKTAVWVHESFEAARAFVYHDPIGPKEGPYTIVPWSAYETKALRLAQERLALAAARMSEVLNHELK